MALKLHALMDRGGEGAGGGRVRGRKRLNGTNPGAAEEIY